MVVCSGNRTYQRERMTKRLDYMSSAERRQRKSRSEAEQLTCLDLFSGCGGFTLGMQRAGFHVLAAVDFNGEAIDTLRANLVERATSAILPVSHALQLDLTKVGPEDLSALIGQRYVDVIVGGPPCQGFSTARQVDGANHGPKLVADERRALYRVFLDFVDYFQPRLFIIENVLGIRSAAGGKYFTRVQKEARDIGRDRRLPGYRVHAQVEDAWALGVPQKRRRQLIVGVRGDLPGYFVPYLRPAPKATPFQVLGEAIGDLPIVRVGGGEHARSYDMPRRRRHLEKYGDAARRYLLKVLEVDYAKQLLNHVARPHNDRDLRDFARLREGESSATAMRDRLVAFEFPYRTDHFKDRYTRQSRSQPCSTIVAHLSKDGLMFIHPTQNRSITPREAARIQSFPDWFSFPQARTHAFRLIGNAVPPLVAEAIGIAVMEFIQVAQTRDVDFNRPRRSAGAGSPLLGESFVRMTSRDLKQLPKHEFLRRWHALLGVLNGLHPNNARDHGKETELWPEARLTLPWIEPRECRRYVRTGWPVVLQHIGTEAWRRLDAGELSLEQFYRFSTFAFQPGAHGSALRA